MSNSGCRQDRAHPNPEARRVAEPVDAGAGGNDNGGNVPTGHPAPNIVQAKEIATPILARFGWRNVSNPNLVNKEGLPASPFQTDNWQGGTAE